MEKETYKTTVHTSQTLPETLLKDIEIIFRSRCGRKEKDKRKAPANGA